VAKYFNIIISFAVERTAKENSPNFVR